MVTPELTLDRLRRIQATLQRRVISRDPANIRSVGFAPADLDKLAGLNEPTVAETQVGTNDISSVTAQFDVIQKLGGVEKDKRIGAAESLRLLDRDARRYDTLRLPTDVREVGEVVPSGVQIATNHSHSSTSVVIRWTTAEPIPPPPPSGEVTQDPRWRWGVLTVSHLFVGRGELDSTVTARVQRPVVCPAGESVEIPGTIAGRVRARGRIPGGPDIALVETGVDRLWLSGFLISPEAPAIPSATRADLQRWTSSGTSGEIYGDRINLRWRWMTFYPSLLIEGLGRLRHIIRYQVEPVGGIRPLDRGTSGSVLVSGGIPVGIQVASTRPEFTVGYAQSLDASLPWLASQLSATSLAIINIVTGPDAPKVSSIEPRQ